MWASPRGVPWIIPPHARFRAREIQASRQASSSRRLLLPALDGAADEQFDGGHERRAHAEGGERPVQAEADGEVTEDERDQGDETRVADDSRDV